MSTARKLVQFGILSADVEEDELELESPLSLVPTGLDPIIAYLEDTYPGEISELNSDDLKEQAVQFASIEKIMIIERLRNVPSDLDSLGADFLWWKDTMDKMLDELLDAGLIERDAQNVFYIDTIKGIALTAHLKSLAQKLSPSTRRRKKSLRSSRGHPEAPPTIEEYHNIAAWLLLSI